MNRSKILPAIILGAASLGLSTSVLATGLFTGVANGTTAVLTGVGNATTYVVGGAVRGTERVVHTTTNMWGGHTNAHRVNHVTTHHVHHDRHH